MNNSPHRSLDTDALNRPAIRARLRRLAEQRRLSLRNGRAEA